MAISTENTFPLIHGGFPLPLHWQGWRTDTHTLKSLGWELHAYERLDDFTYNHVIHIAATSPDSRILIEGTMHIPAQYIVGARDMSNQMFGADAFPVMKFLKEKGMDMKQYSCTDTIRTVDACTVQSMQGLRPIDVYQETPYFKSLKDMKVFAYKDDATSIFIPPESEDELLNKILKIQYPNQLEIKKKLVLPESKPIIKAQIFTLAA